MVYKQQIDELSKGLLRRYAKSSSEEAAYQSWKAGRTNAKGYHDDSRESIKQSQRKQRGLASAIDKISGNSKVNATESEQYNDLEQIDELSKNTLASYQNKAISDVSKRKKKLGSLAHQTWMDHKINNRYDGINKAGQKMYKESLDDLIGHALAQKPIEFANQFSNMMHDKLVELVQFKKEEMASSIFNGDGNFDNYETVESHEIDGEEINELSKKTLGSYADNAFKKYGQEHRLETDTKFRSAYTNDKKKLAHIYGTLSRARDRMDKRSSGIKNAIKKLSGTAKVNATESEV